MDTAVYCGSPEYIAPEILCLTNYGFEVDIYSLGILMYIISVGTYFFSIDELNT